jgi:hypothetical protein
MSAQPSPTTPVDELAAGPVPDLAGFIRGTDIKGQVIHINVSHIELIIPGTNYNTFAMQSGRDLQMVSLEDTTP